MSPKKAVICFICAVTFVAHLAGCHRETADGGGLPGVAAPNHVLSTVAAEKSVAPVRAVILQDKTASSTETRTPLITPEQLQRAIILCKSHGGEVLFGLVRDESNRLFARITIEPPPAASEPFDSNGLNPIVAQREKQRHDKVESDYKVRLSAWNDKVENDERAFLNQVQSLLAEPPDSKRTDIFGGLGRADLAVGEDDALFGAPTHRYIVLVSDGEDNVHKQPVALTSGATLILINGAGSIGSLAALKPHRFENIDGALNFITSQETHTSH